VFVCVQLWYYTRVWSSLRSGLPLARHLAFSPNICLYDMCSLSEGEAVGASHSQSRSAALPSWKRIQLDNEQNPSRIYQILEAGSTQPEALDTVTEIVVKLEENTGIGCGPMKNEHTAPYTEREEARQVKPDHPLRDVLRILDLKNDGTEGASEEERLLKILTWNDPEVFAERQTQLSADPQQWYVQTYISLHDREFIHHAAPLILIMCPNIERLTYSSCPPPYMPDRNVYREHLLPKTLLRNNYGKLPQKHLQKLRHVRLLPEVGVSYNGGDTYEFIDLLAEARLFHRLPAIESISVDGITSNNDADHLGEFPPRTSNVKSIHVGHSMLPSSELAPLIRMPRNLEEFTHSVGGRDSNDGKQKISAADIEPRTLANRSNTGGHYTFTAKTLGKALHTSRHSLLKLDIDVDDMLSDDKHDEEEYAENCAEEEEYGEESYWRDAYFRQDEADSPGPLELYEVPNDRTYANTIGTLHDFEALTHLSVGVKLLLGPPGSMTPFRLIDALPKSLRFLTIRGYTKGVVAKYDAAIGELLARRAEVLPALLEVRGVEECIPGADVEASGPMRPGLRDGGEEVQYWEYKEENEGWLAA
jgi:hypothetical protein